HGHDACVPITGSRMSRLLDNLLIFGRVLRRAGFHVHSGRLAALVEALGYVDLGASDDVYHACRALLVHRHDQMAIFDLAFAVFWREHHDPQPGERARETHAADRPSMVETSERNAEDAADADAAPERRLKTWSDEGTLSGKDFAALTPEEAAEARAALSR